MKTNRVNISLSLIVLICFFLPWVQMSCGTSTDRLSGVELARDGHSGLWLIPVLMFVVLFIFLTKVLKDKSGLSSLVSLFAGLVSAYLMNRERMRTEDASGLIAVGLTGWFWLGLSSTIGLVIVNVLNLVKRNRVT